MNPVEISAGLHRLQVADAATLRRIWTDEKGTVPPKTFTARLMRLVLAWDAQAAQSGGETAQTRRAWSPTIRSRSDLGTKGGAGPRAVSDGTRILKEWGGSKHEVVVSESGATWNGQSYASLSAVARAMTGTNRNGPKFFGLREGAGK